MILSVIIYRHNIQLIFHGLNKIFASNLFKYYYITILRVTS